MGLSEEDDRNIVDLLVDQVEFANVILINKKDLVSEPELQQLTEIVRRLNPNAEVIQATQSRVPLAKIMAPGDSNCLRRKKCRAG